MTTGFCQPFHQYGSRDGDGRPALWSKVKKSQGHCLRWQRWQNVSDPFLKNVSQNSDFLTLFLLPETKTNKSNNVTEKKVK